MILFHKKVSVLLIMALILVLISLAIMVLSSLYDKGSLYISAINIESAKEYITYLLATANILLLYETLISQNRGIKNEKEAYERSQFETTFFNMLDTFRKITDEIKLDYIDLNGKKTRINGREFFVFALIEINKISDSLKSDKYHGKYNQYDADCSLQFLDHEYDNKRIDDEIAAIRWKNEKENEFLLIHSIQYTNLVYDIQEPDFKKLKTNSDLTSVSYSLFCRRFSFVYEHYLRFLKQLLIYISCKQDSLYHDLLNAQLSSQEVKFIKLHAIVLVDEELKNFKSI